MRGISSGSVQKCVPPIVALVFNVGFSLKLVCEALTEGEELMVKLSCR